MIFFLAFWIAIVTITLAAPAPQILPPPLTPPALLLGSGGNSGCEISGGGYSVQGYSTPEGACRFSLQYGEVSQRWAYSTVPTSINFSTIAIMPPQCPQPTGTYVDSGYQSEDCLYAVVYTPQPFPAMGSLPVFVWIHGGSYIQGGASAPGLDGSTLAKEGNVIVIVLQYRLGVLGYLPPSETTSSQDPNLGLLDVINALQSIQKYIQYIGGNSSQVTIAGQSSGAGMIRALLGAPSAKGLFRSAILQSDPMGYGFASTSITKQLQSALYSQPPFSSCSTLQCLQEIPVAEIIDAEMNLTATAPATITGVPLAEVFRPTYGTNSLPTDPTVDTYSSQSNNPAIQPGEIPLMITTVAYEGGSVVEQLFPSPVPDSDSLLYDVLSELIDPGRATTIVSTPAYNGSNFPGEDGFRNRLTAILTDAAWRCADRDIAAKWAQEGGTVYVAEWEQGVSYPDNQIPGGYCQDKVCHEDDIYPTFGTAPNPNSSTLAFEEYIRQHWISFVKTQNPNPAGSPLAPSMSIWERWSGWFLKSIKSSRLESEPRQSTPITTWSAITAQGQNVFPLGGNGQVLNCPPGIWGQTVKYDFQLYG